MALIDSVRPGLLIDENDLAKTVIVKTSTNRSSMGPSYSYESWNYSYIRYDDVYWLR